MSTEKRSYVGPYMELPNEISEKDFQSIINETLWNPWLKHANIWIPNVKRNNPRFFNSDDFGGAIKIDSFDVIKEIEWFKEAFGQEVKQARKIFKEIHICWGFINYYI